MKKAELSRNVKSGRFGMFPMDDRYIEARLFMLLASLGSPVVPTTIEPGESLSFASIDDFDNWTQDEELLKRTLNSQSNVDAVDLIVSIQGKFTSDQLKFATKEDFKKCFS